MQVYPEKSDQLELSVHEKTLLRSVERAFSKEEGAYYVLQINPRKKDLGKGRPELFHLLLFERGIFLFQILTLPGTAPEKVLGMLCDHAEVYGTIRADIAKKLEESRYLTDAAGKLRVPFHLCLVLPEIDGTEVLGKLHARAQNFCRKNILFRDTIKRIRQEGSSVLHPYLVQGERLREEDINHVFQRLCPELTIPKKYILDENERIHIEDGRIGAHDRAVQAYRLDNWQINTVNRIAKGNQLILACAGSGKSVLLISRCFKLASLNPGARFLLTCYNKNLADYYRWAVAQAGFTDRNVRCSTFFSLCMELLRSNGIRFYSKKSGADYFDELFERANSALEKGLLKERFYGVFIDEVQIFKPEWYRFCFNLLVSKNAEDHFFVISGDKAQDVKNHIKHGKAPWQGGVSGYPEYRGKTISIEKNYRNSKPISDAIDRYVTEAKKQGMALGLDYTADPESFLHGEAYRPGNPPVLVELTDFSNDGETEAIGAAVKNLMEEKGLRESDIAIVLFNKYVKFATPGWKNRSYYLERGIQQYFERQGWEPPSFLYAGKSEGTTYGSRRGVTVVSIEGALGLDFRGVVLAGLRPLGTHEKTRVLSEFAKAEPKDLPDKLEAFKKNVNLVYTACTRAKDELTVILSAPKGESIYMDLLRRSMGEA